MKQLCEWHDNAYTKGSLPQKIGIPQSKIDKHFREMGMLQTERRSATAFENLVSLPKRAGKAIMIKTAYGIIRVFTKFFDIYEGRK